MSPSYFSSDATRSLSRSDAADPGSLSPGQQAQPMSHLTLQQALAQMHFDVMQELERFRRWQRLQRRAPSPSLNARPSQITPNPNRLQRPGQSRQQGASVQRSLPVLLQEVVEDLEIEERQPFGGIFSPWVVLLLWVLSCAGIGLGVRWLIWPEELSRPQTSSLPSKAEPGIPIGVNLDQLPLIPLEPVETQVGEEFYSGNWDPGQVALGLASTPNLQDLQVAPLRNTPNPLDSLQRDLASPTDKASSPEQGPRTIEQLVATLERPSQQAGSVATPSPLTANSNLAEGNVDSLGPNQGEGTFLVLTTYLGDESLARARQVADGAFVRDVGGQKFVQLAAFKQLEHARYHAETLESQGFKITIAEQ